MKTIWGEKKAVPENRTPCKECFNEDITLLPKMYTYRERTFFHIKGMYFFLENLELCLSSERTLWLAVF